MGGGVMSECTYDGGTAFPLADGNGACDTGMTLRDYFAARAMLKFNGEPEWEARKAYEMADAMLQERSK
jgi:hypothetical protein